MNISGIRSVGSTVNSISVSSKARISSADLSKINSSASSNGAQDREANARNAEALKKAKAKQTFGIYDFDALYKPDAKFVDEGQRLDTKAVESKVSDIKKDELMTEYKTFVGDNEKETKTNESAKPSIRSAENFDF